MSDAQPTPSDAAGAATANQLDQLVDRAIRDAVDRFRGNVLAELHADVVASAIAAVAAHIRAATNAPDQLDPRIDSAIDDFLAPPFPRREADGTITAIDDDGFIVQRGRPTSSIPAATLAQMATVPIEIVDAEEPQRGSAG